MSEQTPDEQPLERILADAARLDLLEHVAELEARGCTVVRPEQLEPAVPVDDMYELVLDLMEQRNGTRPDVETGATHAEVSFPTLYYFLFEDPRFEAFLLHPVLRCLVDYLLGERCILHATAVFMKGPSDTPDDHLQLGLHTDQQWVPDPMPAYPLIAGATLLLTDYTRDDGAFAYVPGSHTRCRHPVGFEDAKKAVPIDAPRGSLLVHDGRLWHGSFGRSKPGLRAGMAFAFSRMFVTPLEAFRENVTKDVLDKYPERFAQLLSQRVPTGSTEDGPDLAKVGYGVTRTWWD